MTAPRLDYVPRLVEANRAYRVEAPTTDLTRVSRWWTGGAVLDQGVEGSCVGHGVVGEYLASPARGTLGKGLNDLGRQIAGHRLAVAVYGRAKEIDEFEGVNYDGTSVRAGMLVARERGWCAGFRWAFGMAELRAALEDGPVVVGTAWSSDAMNDTDAYGDLRVEGNLAVGHCWLVTGYSPNYAGRGPRYRGRNSWGPDWGLNGNFYLRPEHLERILFGSGGEAAVPAGRAA